MKKGDDKMVSRLKNKVMTTMGNVLPDTALAGQKRKLHEERSDDKTSDKQ